MKIIVFLGPTMTIAEAKTVLPDAIYLPPAGQSDLMSAVTIHRPQVIALIDGVFSQSLSVWHKEILFALDQGVHVYGASSMGALRAAETDVFGMVGVGSIYRMYQQGELTDDDEVALAHGSAEDDYHNFSEPMVNIRATLRSALEAGRISQATHDVVIASAKSLYFPERTYSAILRIAELEGLSPEAIAVLQDCVRKHTVNLKRQDALELLALLRDLPLELPPFVADFTFNRSHLFAALYERDRLVVRPVGEVSLNAIASYAALHLPDFLTFNMDAINHKLTLVLAHLLKIEASDKEVEAEQRRFRIRLSLRTKDQLAAWLANNDLTETEFTTLMREVAICRRVHRWAISKSYLQGNVQTVLDRLRLTDRYSAVADAAAQQQKILHETQPMFFQTDHNHLSVETLVLEHLNATECRMDVSFPVWLEEAGFDNASHLWLELLQAKLVRDATEHTTEQAIATETL